MKPLYTPLIVFLFTFLTTISLAQDRGGTACSAQLTAKVNGTAKAVLTVNADTTLHFSYSWIIGQDTIPHDPSTGTTYYPFDSNGTYTVCLSAVDTLLPCTFDTCFQLTVTNADYIPLLDSVNEWQEVILPNVFTKSPQPGSRDECGLGMKFIYENRFFTTDTVTLSGKSYLKLYAQLNSNLPCHAGYIREDVLNRKIYALDVYDTTESLLYDFGLEVGQSVYVYCLATTWLGSNNNPYKLDSVGKVNIGGRWHRVFYVNRPSALKMQWVEGIGSFLHPFYKYALEFMHSDPYFCHSIPLVPDYSNLPYLSCFSHLEKVYYDTCAYQEALSNSSSCFVVENVCSYGNICSSLDNISSISSLSISPNPASRQVQLTLELNMATEVSVKVVDIHGRAVSDLFEYNTLAGGKHQIALSLPSRPSGLYFVECNTTEGSTYRKLLVE